MNRLFTPQQHRISIAPMMDKTHRHFRFFLRQLSTHMLLYTEMISAEAIIHGKCDQLLNFAPIEHPIALQLGGHTPELLYQACRIAQQWDYDEINLNVGCPSNKVSQRGIGACLMQNPQLVAEMLSAMREATNKPITIKHRIGIESPHANIMLSHYDDLYNFISTIDTYADRYTVHARIALLEGLSPQENRSIPPLRYHDVYQLCTDFPHLLFEINGNINNHTAIAAHLLHVPAVMIGRASYKNPWFLREIDYRYYNAPAIRSCKDIIDAYIDYLSAYTALSNKNPQPLLWPLLSLFHGLPGSRKWKQSLSRSIPQSENLKQFVTHALLHIPEYILYNTDISINPLYI